VPILEGYGLTETTAAVTVNLPDAQRIGTVGRPIPGTTVRVTDDGELMFRGGQIFSGYWHDPEATNEALVDGWLLTGDVGEIDDDGYVRVTGRKKEIIVTAGGKNVAPAVLEDRVRAHPLVSQCMVVGDGRPFVAALVTLDPESLAQWMTAHKRTGSADSMVRDPDVLAEVQRAIDDANSAVSRAEGIRAFTIVTGDWTEAGGELTPTLKLKRNVVLRTHHHDIEALYP
jgi:long-chain acyl-CoA synthetase